MRNDPFTLDDLDEDPGFTRHANDEKSGEHRDSNSTGPQPYPLVMFRDISLDSRKAWLVENVFGMGELSDCFGAPGCGKSVFIGNGAFHCAAGIAWFGRRVTQGAVLYVAAERAELVKRRFAALRMVHGCDDIPLAVIGGAFSLASRSEDTERLIATAEELTATTGFPVVWIIIDTKARVMAGGDENSSKDMGQLVSNLGRLQEATGAHITVIDHIPHDGNRMRGHGALLGAVDATFRISKQGDIRLMEIDKVNDGPDDIRFPFTLDSITLSTDPETGEETTAPIVRPLDPHDAPARREGRRTTKAGKIALNALLECIAETGTTPPASNHIPQGVKVATLDQWREYSARMGISPTGGPDAIRIAFKRASESLIASGMVGVWTPYAWPSG